jgi:hypothetical protein
MASGCAPLSTPVTECWLQLFLISYLPLYHDTKQEKRGESISQGLPKMGKINLKPILDKGFSNY